MEATIEYKDSPNESTAYAVIGDKKSTVQLVATPAGDLELSTSPNVSTGYLSIDGQKHKVSLVHNVEGELELPKSATSDSAYVKTQDGRKHKVRLTADISVGGGGGGAGTTVTKFGASIDNLLGNLDANGVYTAPDDSYVLDLSGMTDCGYAYAFAHFAEGPGRPCVGLKANDLVQTNQNFAFYKFATDNKNFESVEFSSLENTSDSAFSDAFPYAKQAYFPKLKRMDNYAFARAFAEVSSMQFDKVFPVLEVIRLAAMSKIIKTSSGSKADFKLSKVKEIYGASSGTNLELPFYSTYCNLYLPRCTFVDRYILHKSYNLPLHFAAQNQAAIEACTGYEYLFGAAEIYFDLMLNITVNGTVYDREHTIDGYTSWKDSNGNLVYTDATAEPAVGTTVYADQGITQVGTVEGVA